ncbi:MAG: M36 family metallopeptidase [Candidatus Riflebacteria bacterium]|nr:M36 family metallopeptidase [Candidatus Riflebacteria bacterium]
MKTSIRRLCVVFLLLIALPGFCYLPVGQSNYFEKKSTLKEPSESVSTPDNELLSAVVNLHKRSNTVDRVCFSSDGKRLTSITGDFTFSGSPKDIVKDFLRDNNSLLTGEENYVPSELEIIESGNSTQFPLVPLKITCQERFNGKKVLGSAVDFHFDSKNALISITGSFLNSGTPENKIVLSFGEAISAARKYINVTEERVAPSAEYVIHTDNSGTRRWAIAVELAASEPLGDWNVVIDAADGSVISMVNQMYALEGKGSVYVSNPLSSSPTVEILPYLYPKVLAGSYSYAVNAKCLSATSPENIYVFEPNNIHFDEVNVYYHTNVVHEFFSKFGFNKLDFSLWGTVHFRVRDNAFFSTKEKKMYFGDGETFNDFALDETVIYHEYAHGVLNEIVSLYNMKESGAINEGQADYFAGSMINSSKSGRWIVAKMGLDCHRNLENSRHYPEDIKDEVHEDGLIWGGFLWDLGIALDRDITDNLIHKSFYYLKAGDPTFADGLTALISADKALYRGINSRLILEIASKRGISASSKRSIVMNKKDISSLITFSEIHKD